MALESKISAEKILAFLNLFYLNNPCCNEKYWIDEGYCTEKLAHPIASPAYFEDTYLIYRVASLDLLLMKIRSKLSRHKSIKWMGFYIDCTSNKRKIKIYLHGCLVNEMSYSRSNIYSTTFYIKENLFRVLSQN